MFIQLFIMFIELIVRIKERIIICLWNEWNRCRALQFFVIDNLLLSSYNKITCRLVSAWRALCAACPGGTSASETFSFYFSALLSYAVLLPETVIKESLVKEKSV